MFNRKFTTFKSRTNHSRDVRKYYMNIILEYQKSLPKIEKSYSKFKKRFYGQVVEWFWTKGSYHELLPYYFEQNSYTRGKKLKAEPSNKINCYKYGLNQNGTIIVAQRYYMNGISQYYETFYDYDKIKDEIHTYSFDYELKKTLFSEKKDIINFTIFKYENFLLRESLLIAKGGWNNCYFNYDNGKLIEQVIKQPSPDPSLQEVTLVYGYDSKDNLVSIKNGNQYWFKKPNQSLKKLSKLVEETLLNCIIEELNNEKPKDSLFSIFLSYSYENHIPPSIYLCTTEDKERLLNEDSDIELIDQNMWNDPTDFKYQFDISARNENDDDVFRQFNQEISMLDTPDEAINLIIHVCIGLKKKVCELDLILEDDFLVTASDWDGNDFKNNFKIINKK